MHGCGMLNGGDHKCISALVKQLGAKEQEYLLMMYLCITVSQSFSCFDKVATRHRDFTVLAVGHHTK